MAIRGEVLDGRRKSAILSVWNGYEATAPKDVIQKVAKGTTMSFSYLENHEPGHNKYYRIWIVNAASGYEVWTRWGRCGTSGQQKILTTVGDYSEARRWAQLQTDKKLGRGYQPAAE